MENNITLNSSLPDGITTGGTGSSGGYGNDQFITTIQPLVQQYYYPYYQTYWVNEDKMSKAFKLAQKLIEKRLIKEPAKVKDFIELVNCIVELL